MSIEVGNVSAYEPAGLSDSFNITYSIESSATNPRRKMIVFVGWDEQTTTSGNYVSDVTYDSKSLTQIISASEGSFPFQVASLHYIDEQDLGSTEGDNTISVNFNTSFGAGRLGIIVCTLLDAASGTPNYSEKDEVTSTNTSASIDYPQGESLILSFLCSQDGEDFNFGSGQIEIIDQIYCTGVTIGGSYETKSSDTSGSDIQSVTIEDSKRNALVTTTISEQLGQTDIKYYGLINSNDEYFVFMADVPIN